MAIAAGVVLIIFVVFFLILVFAGNMIVIVGGQQVGILERRYFGRPLPVGRVVALRGEIGFQARALQPGLTILFPFLYIARKVDMIVINEDEVGILESIDGQPLEPGRIFARHVPDHDSFQDGEAFLTNGGQKGPQVDFLAPGQYQAQGFAILSRFRNLFDGVTKHSHQPRRKSLLVLFQLV